MGGQLIPLAGKISAKDFTSYLTRYDACIKAISDSRGGKLMLAEYITVVQV